jgi:hypothetical protein
MKANNTAILSGLKRSETESKDPVSGRRAPDAILRPGVSCGICPLFFRGKIRRATFGSPLRCASAGMTRTGGFVLLEIMLAVAIFAIGVIALGWSVNNCLTAETVKNDDQRATQALRNRETEIERGSVIVSDSQTTELEGVFTGITVKQTRTPLKLKNENNLDLAGLYQIDLEATWESGDEPQKKTLSFYMLSNQ